MKYLVLCLALVGLVWCCSGVDPKSVQYASAYRATAPQSQMGVTYGTKKALVIPASVLNCLTTGLGKAVNLIGETGVCIFENITPPVKKALMIPPSILKCGTDWLNKIVTATGEGIMCVGENITPDVVIPILTAPAPANASVCAPAPAAAPACSSGSCAPPPAKAAGCR